MSSSAFFTPPLSKSNAEKKACLCHWGDDCSELKTFFDKNKSELGQVIKVRYAETCNFVNFYNAAIKFLRIPMRKQQELRQLYDEHKADPTNKPCPRIMIAKFHFPYILALTTTQWTSPMLRGKVDELECYIDRSPPPQDDALIIYNPDLGEGQSVRAKKASNGKTQFRVVPCATRAEVKLIAAGMQNNNGALQPSKSTNKQINSRIKVSKVAKPKTKHTATAVATTIRSSSAVEVEQSAAASVINRPSSLVSSLTKHRHKRKVEEVAVRLEMEENEAQQRTPDQWRKIIIDERSEMEEKNAKLEAHVESLMEQLRKKEEEAKQMKGHYEKQRKKVRRTKSSIATGEQATECIGSDVEVVWEKCLALLSNAGGISRLTIFNDEWHANHTDAARLLWGYNSWTEAKLYVDVFFGKEVDVNYDPSANVRASRDGDLILPRYLTEFENGMACRMFFHVFAQEQIIALCFDRHRTRVGQILKKWAPKWAAVGMDLSCLDITSDYIFKEVPDRNINLGMPRLVFVDGKDWLIAPKGNDTTVEKCTYSSKTEKTSARSLTFSTAGGLVFEWAPLFGGRGGERKIVEFMSELGIETAPISEWEDVANNVELEDNATFWTALSDVMTAKEFDETINRLEEGDSLLSNGLLDDGILITGQPTGLAREGLDVNDADTDEEREDDEHTSDADAMMKSGRHVFGIEHALNCFGEMVKSKIVENAQRESGSDKRPPILTPEILQEQNRKALRNDPNRSGKRKLLQLERLQKLHLLYEEAKLKKCLLSYYLLVTEDQRLKLLSWMGSTLASHITKPSLDELPKLPLRLAKIPEDCGLGGDKGFSGIEYSLPNCNEVVTPPQVANSKKQRLSKDQIESEVPITSVRAPCETVFKRVDNEAVMKEKVPYWIFLGCHMAMPLLMVRLICVVHYDFQVEIQLLVTTIGTTIRITHVFSSHLKQVRVFLEVLDESAKDANKVELLSFAHRVQNGTIVTAIALEVVILVMRTTRTCKEFRIRY